MNGISISTCFDYEISFENQLRLIKKAGFSHISIGSDYNHSGILQSENWSGIKALAKGNHLLIDTIHGCALDKADTLEVNTKLAQAAQYLDVPVMVLHCSAFAIHPNSLDERKKDILSILPKLEQIAEAYNIVFAFENVLPGPATELTEFAVNNSSPEYFGFCYDSSHDQIDGPRSFDLLKRNISRLKAVHISDRIREFVDHVIPGEGFIDFDVLSGILQSANPQFPLLIEVMTEHSKYKEANRFLAAAYTEAQKLYDKINN